MNQSINYEAVCKTALATPGLLKKIKNVLSLVNFFKVFICWPVSLRMDAIVCFTSPPPRKKSFQTLQKNKDLFRIGLVERPCMEP